MAANYFAKLAHNLGNFCKRGQNLSFFKWYQFWATFIDIWRLFTGHTVYKLLYSLLYKVRMKDCCHRWTHRLRHLWWTHFRLLWCIDISAIKPVYLFHICFMISQEFSWVGCCSLLQEKYTSAAKTKSMNYLAIGT